MRNWNSLLYNSLYHQSPVSEYLWGIETYLPSLHFPGLRRYQNTYEELKHIISMAVFFFNLVSEYLWGIETTIFTWCLFPITWSIRIPMRNWNFFILSSWCPCIAYQNTYEELKLAFNLSRLSVGEVSEFLWGIETQLPTLLDEINK